MDKIIQNNVNDTVAYICNIIELDEDHYNYGIVPKEVSFGRINDKDQFISENGEHTLEEVRSIFDREKECDLNSLYYFKPIKLQELRIKYPETMDSSELAVFYFNEIKESILLLYKLSKNAMPVIEPMKKIDPADINKVNEDQEKRYFGLYENRAKNTSVNDVDMQLASIKRRDLANFVKARVLGNDDIIDTITATIVQNFRTNNPRDIENLFCIGPSGSGKTYTYQCIAEYADLPITIYDCNSLTAAGYVGKSVDDIFKTMYSNVGGNVDKLRRSILVLDELDKIAERGAEVKDRLVQDALLKVIEGAPFDFEMKYMGESKRIDTSLMTKVAAGAFQELFEVIQKKQALGFGVQGGDVEVSRIQSIINRGKKINDEDIIKYGFKTELIGRFEKIKVYNPTDKEGLKRILTVAKNSALALKIARFLRDYEVTLKATEDYLDAVACKALTKKTGARSLKTIVSESLEWLSIYMMDEKDSGHKLPKEYVLTPDLVENPKRISM